MTSQAAIPPAGEPAADDLAIQRLRVQVMPEFDDPRVLVVIQGRLEVSGATLPVPVTFRVPSGAQINQMAAMDLDSGATVPRSYDTRQDPDDPRWSLVTFTLDNAHFFYEYYYSPPWGDKDKAFTFIFSSLQPVVDLLVEVQQPLAASSFNLDPPPGGSRLDDLFDLTYHQLNIGSLAAGGETTIKVSYTKTDPEPSLSREQVSTTFSAHKGKSVVSGASPSAHDLSGNHTSTLWIPVLLGAAALAGILGFVRHRVQARNAVLVPVMVIGEKQFCTHCGTRRKANARFCHICGAS